MEKPVLATNIDSLLLEHEVFTEPHIAWFDRAMKKTGDNSLEKWKGSPEYFKGVNEAMAKLMPKAPKEKQTKQARKWYQKDVIKYISMHPEKVKRDIADKLRSLKDKYRIILLTTNTRRYISKILSKAKLKGIYDGIIASRTEEEPDKKKLVDELVLEYGKPEYYLTGKPEEDINSKFKELKVKIIGTDKISEL